MKYRIHIWGNPSTGRIRFGVEAQEKAGAKYKHASATIDGINRALIYEAEDRAKEVVQCLNENQAVDLKDGLVPLISRGEGKEVC